MRLNSLSDHGILVKETNSDRRRHSDVSMATRISRSGLSRVISAASTPITALSLKDDFANTVNHDYLYANPATDQLKTSADSVRGDEPRLADGDQFLGLFPCRKHGGWRE
jgi:hypothetical protein